MEKILLVLFLSVYSSVKCERLIFSIDEDSVCETKTSCVSCLSLEQCSWCAGETKCFSSNLKIFNGYCVNDSLPYKDFGLSLDGNGKCSCNSTELERKCYPPGVTEGPECSGRGACECGRCVCDPMPDPEHPTKTVIGDFCEYDNFSCDGPECDEGPYLYSLSDTNLDES